MMIHKKYKRASAATRTRESLIDAVNVFTFFGFALAQPLFDLLSQNSQFFVARHSKPLDVLLLSALLCFVCPALVVAAGEILGIVHKRIRGGYYFIVFTMLAASFALPIFKRFLDISGPAMVAAAAVSALLFAFLYMRFRPFRLNLTFLSPAILAFPILFLFSSGIYEIVFPGKNASYIKAEVKKPAPVVFVVFDELPLTSLMNEERVIDPVRYPNFAALAEDSYWFRNATTVSANTMFSIPSMLSGRFPTGEAFLPTSAHHPRQLFTLLSGSYEIKPFEIVTELCPDELVDRKEKQPVLAERMRSLVADLSVVYLHVLLPSDFSARLPGIRTSWKDFAQKPPETPQPDLEALDKKYAWTFFWDKIDWDDRTEIVRRFVDSIESDDRQTLFFMHVMLPHSGWSYLPSGKRHTLYKDHEIRGLVGENTKGLPDDLWTDAWSVTQMFQRHLLQVRLVDKLLGDIAARLKSTGLYEQSLIVITADHGISFQAGTRRRGVDSKNYCDIMAIPLLIKVPRQTRGVVSDRNVETVDILPTIADILGIDLPWSVDGRSALDLNQPERENKAIYDNAGTKIVFEPSMAGKYKTLRHIIDLFGSGTDERLFNIGPYNGLIGRKVTESKISQQKSLEVFLEYQKIYANMDLGARFIPANIIGRIVSKQRATKPIHLAVAVNGTIAAVTETFIIDGEMKFSALVPEESFKEGFNEIGIFLARGPNVSDLLRAKIVSK